MHRILHVAIAMAIGFIFFRFLLDFFTPFIIGLAIALLMEPLVRFLTLRGRFKRSLAAFVSLLILTLAGASIGRMGVSALYREAGEFLEQAPAYVTALQEWLAAYPFIPAAGLLTRLGEWLSTQSIRAVSYVPGVLIGILLILFSAFFFSRDREIIFDFIVRWSPDWLTQYAEPIGIRLYRAAGGFLKCEFILFAMVATACIIGLWMLRSPYAMMLGLVTALFDSLPIVGSGLILWPWAGYLALTGQHAQAAGLLVLYGVITVIRNFIGPKILGDQIDMHPLAAVMAIFIGIKAFGAAGLLAGPAMVIAAQAMIDKEA